MKILIDIDEEIYKCSLPYKDVPVNSNMANYNSEITCAIANGISLPKGHGRLIDVKDLLYEICLEDNDYNRDVNMGEIITLEDIDRIPTIIEADTGETE